MCVCGRGGGEGREEGEGDGEANDSFQRQFSPSCNFSKCRLKIR